MGRGPSFEGIHSIMKVNRWVILAAAALSGLMCGTIYCWSIFKNPLMEVHGWSSNEVTLAYSLFALLMLLGTFLGGPLQKLEKPRLVVLVAGAMQGLGFVLTGFAQDTMQLYLAYSLLAGIGDGIVYGVAVATATKWFPDKKGMANGICLGCMGLAPLIFAPFGDWLIGSVGVLVAFQVIGWIQVVCFAIAALFIQAAPEGWRPDGWEPSISQKVGARVEVRTSRMLRTPLFWLQWVLLVAGIASGSMMAGQASAIGQSMAPITASEGSILVALLAVASFSGRLLLGSLSDKVGRYPVLFGAMLASAVDLLLFMPQAHTFAGFAIAMFVVGLAYGGIMANVPNLTSDSYGSRYFGLNFPCMFSAYTVAAFVGPMVASDVFQSFGSYGMAFAFAGALSAAGCLLVIAAAGLSRRMFQNEASKGRGISLGREARG